MKKVIAFGASSSSTSINQQLVEYAASLVTNADVEVIKIRDLEVPMFSVDDEAATGVPSVVEEFQKKLAGADAFMISVAENNSNVTAYFKSLFDWLSRLDDSGMKEKPLLLMSASTGRRAGKTAHEIATVMFERQLKVNVVATYQFPKFASNFQDGVIVNEELDVALKDAVGLFEQSL